MKTDELIDMLSTNVEPVKGAEPRNLLMIALAVGAVAALCLMLAIFGGQTRWAGKISVSRRWRSHSRWAWLLRGRDF